MCLEGKRVFVACGYLQVLQLDVVFKGQHRHICEPAVGHRPGTKIKTRASVIIMIPIIHRKSIHHSSPNTVWILIWNASARVIKKQPVMSLFGFWKAACWVSRPDRISLIDSSHKANKTGTVHKSIKSILIKIHTNQPQLKLLLMTSFKSSDGSVR